MDASGGDILTQKMMGAARSATVTLDAVAPQRFSEMPG